MFRTRSSAARGLAAADVVHLYRTLFEREPSPEEVAAQSAATDDWRELLAAMVRSGEYRMVRPTAFGPGDGSSRVVNVWHPDLADWGHPAGTWSADGEAVMGRQGFVFLARGTNAVLDQYQADFALPRGWSERWAQTIGVRRAEAERLGAQLATIIVPDKLSILQEHLPAELSLQSSPPAALLAQRHGVAYPVAELAAVADGAYLRTDTHLSFAGNVAVAASVLRALGVAATLDGPDGELAQEYLSCGDLGSRFAPQVVEVMRTYGSWGAARLIDDNRAAVEAVGKHVGTRRVLRNDDSVDERTAVVFGDSYAFPQEHYHGIAWYLAQHFREVHFVWVPFGWDNAYVEQVGGRVVVCETAERFVPRPPADRIDVQELMEAGIARS